MIKNILDSQTNFCSIKHKLKEEEIEICSKHFPN